MKQSDKTDNEVKYVVQRFLMIEPKLFRIVRRLDAILLDSQKGEEE